MNWIRQEKRLAIYLRDGLACVWCGSGIEDGAQMMLDHVLPHSEGGSNLESNLVTACHACNSRRGSRSVVAFADDVASYVNHGVTGDQIIDDIAKRTSTPLKTFRAEAKALVARRGSAARALANLSL